MKDTNSLMRHQLNSVSLSLVIYVILSTFTILHLHGKLMKTNETINRVVNVQYKIAKKLSDERD